MVSVGTRLPRKLAMLRRAPFIVIDGADFTGKSTQARRLADTLRRGGRRVLHVRDPGGTRIGEAVRGILLDPAHRAMAMTTETLLYMAARAQLVAEVIRPTLAHGVMVVCERYLLSTAVYQGVAGGAGVEPVFAMGRFAIGPAWPDLTILLDMDLREAARRRRGRPRDRIESRGLAFQRRVRAGFRRLARGRRDVMRVDARGSEEEVAERIWAVLAAHMKLPPPNDQWKR